MFCTSCGKKANKTRTIDSSTKVCNQCPSRVGQTVGMPNGIDDDSTLSDIKFGDFKVWINTVISKVINDELSDVKGNVDKLKEGMNELTQQKLQIELLKQRCDIYEENIATLKSTIANQQKSLNTIDSNERVKNLIISGLNEEDIIEGDDVYKSDEEKVAALFRVIGTTLPNNCTLTRLGKRNDRYARIIKLNVQNRLNRDNILKKTRDLKNANDIWKSVYLKKDLHPAIIHENRRIHKKLNILKSLDENKEKDVRLERGKLKVNGTIVDENLFFV